MTRLLFLLLVGLLHRSSLVPRTEVEPPVRFRIKHAGITVNGSLADLQTNLLFDPERLEASKLEGSVAVGSVRTGIGLRDGHLQKKGFFDAAQYPRIRMVSKRLRKEAGNGYLGTFDLTIRDATREVAVPFTCIIKGNKGHFTTHFTLDRRDFGVGDNSLVMGDEVTVFIDLEAPLKAFE
jgi:polyisoprenoid-binding protein YceI